MAQSRRYCVLEKIISGGQTGADRGALDAALSAGFACGGACPRDRRAEDGPIPDRYPLTELASTRYLERTRRNVVDSDGTLVVTRQAPAGGTLATIRYARRAGKPCLVLTPADADDIADSLATAAAWLSQHSIRTLNVAGPRASSDPVIQDVTRALVAGLISPS